ncbi:hypothetical protein EDB85DRAFT_1903087 [Lactarius pseudohatsudake]|nr:hypothetical protein EDB85DRAFT_1903087 [Lactarius pseudohatsudake]
MHGYKPTDRHVLQKIRKWYYNHYSPPHRQVIKFVRRWSARNVFYHEDKADIMKLAEDMSGAAPGTETFFGSIQDATTELWKKLPGEEQERFAQTAEEWSDNGPPKGIQAKMASAAIRGRIVRDFQTQLYRTCGAHCIVLLAYQKEDGTPQVSMDEWNADWRSTVLWDTWKKLAGSALSKMMIKMLRGPFKDDQDPCPDNHQCKLGSLKFHLLSRVMDINQGFISGKPYATIPWAKLSTTPTAWIQEECYPPGFKWADPSKIRLNDVHDLLIYWRQRKEMDWIPSSGIHHMVMKRNYAQELNNITDKQFGLTIPPPPPSLHPVQRGPAGSDTEGLEQAGIGFAQSLEHPSLPHHSSSFNVERSDNMQPSEPTPTELTHNPARAQSNPQQHQVRAWHTLKGPWGPCSLYIWTCARKPAPSAS